MIGRYSVRPAGPARPAASRNTWVAGEARGAANRFPAAAPRYRGQPAAPADHDAPAEGQSSKLSLSDLPAGGGASYAVAPGDSLWAIASRWLDDGSRWPEIYALNIDVIGANPNLILPGEQLKLPDEPSPSAPAPDAPAAPSASDPAPDASVAPSASDPTAAQFDFNLSPAQIANALGCPVENVQQNWPVISQALKQAGITSKAGVIAALATIGVESSSFQPIAELDGGNAYNGRADLGNTQPGDGPRFKGRGFIQITGRDNYRTYGDKLGLDLVNNPDQALNPDVAAKILAQYFVDHDIPQKADAGNWSGVRTAVNGGLNGYDQFLANVHNLQQAIG